MRTTYGSTYAVRLEGKQLPENDNKNCEFLCFSRNKTGVDDEDDVIRSAGIRSETDCFCLVR